MKYRLHLHTWFISAWMLTAFLSMALPVHGESVAVSVKKTFLTRQPEGSIIYIESSAFNADRTQLAYVAASKDGMRVVVNQSVGKQYDHVAKGYPVFSPEHNRVGYIADKKGNYYVVVDGKEYPGYKGACCLHFSPDGNHFWYIAQQGEQQFVVFDGRALPKHDMIDRQRGVMFSPDSRHFAYIARNKTENSVRVVHDNTTGPPYDKISEIAFSPDSAKLVYIAIKNKAYYIIQNNTIVKGPLDKVEALTWHPDSVTFACVGIKTGNFIIIKGEQEIKAGSYNVKTVFDKEKGYTPLLPQITPPVFSPDGIRLAFTKMTGQQYQTIINGMAGPAFDLVSTVIFSPDSKHYAYIGINKNPYVDKQVVIRDGKLQQAFENISSPAFSPDSRHLAYQAFSEGKWRMVIDGKSHAGYEALGDPVFSPTSSILAYRAIVDKQWRIVNNGKEGPAYDAVSRPFFSADGKHLAYYASFENRILMIVDNVEMGPYLDVTRPYFSPDGNHVAYLAKQHPEQTQSASAVCILDGEPVAQFTTYMPGIKNQIVFDAPDRFHFIASYLNQNDNIFETFLIEITINRQSSRNN